MPRSQHQPGPACGARAQSLGSCPSSARSRPDEEPGRSVPRFPRRRGWGGAGIQCGRPRAAGRPRKQRRRCPLPALAPGIAAWQPPLDSAGDGTPPRRRRAHPSPAVRWRWRQSPGTSVTARRTRGRGRRAPPPGLPRAEAACARPAGTPPAREAGAQTLAAILSGQDVHRGLKSGSAGTPASGVLGGLSGPGGVGRCGPFRFATLVELGGHPRMSSPSMERRKRGPGEWGSGSGRGQASVAVFIRSVVGVFSGPSLGFQVISLLFAQEMLFPP